jgi:surfactin synthase thioesterase subunit
MSAAAEALPIWCRPLATETTEQRRPIRLFCFPHAGGNANFFKPWRATFAHRAQVVAVQYPGHGHRSRSPARTSMTELVDALIEELSPLLDRPSAFFGHSLGAWVAYELAVRLEREGRIGPSHLFVSASPKPPPPAGEPRRAFGEPDDESIVALARFVSPSGEALSKPLLRAYALPILRADMKIVAGYAPSASAAVACPITAFGAWDDPIVPVRTLRGWSTYTRASSRCLILEGDHFYLQAQREVLCREILSEVRAGIGRAQDEEIEP